MKNIKKSNKKYYKSTNKICKQPQIELKDTKQQRQKS